MPRWSVTGTTASRRRPLEHNVQAIRGSGDAPFELRYPDTWTDATSGIVASDDPVRPIAVLRRSDGRGVVSLKVRGELTKSLEEIAEGLTAKLAEAFDDFQLVSSKPLDVPAGTGLYTSWVLQERRQVHANLVVHAAGHTYLLDAAMPAGETQVAREVGAIFNSFDVTVA